MRAVLRSAPGDSVTPRRQKPSRCTPTHWGTAAMTVCDPGQIRSSTPIYLGVLSYDRAIRRLRIRNCQEENQFTSRSLTRSARLIPVHFGASRAPRHRRLLSSPVCGISICFLPERSSESRRCCLPANFVPRPESSSGRVPLPVFSVGWKKRFSVSPFFGIFELKRLSRVSRSPIPPNRETLKAHFYTVVKARKCRNRGR